MKVQFTSDHLSDLEILIPASHFEIIAKVGDYIMIQDYMMEDEKQLFEDHMNSIDKIVLGTVNAIIWNRIEEENIVTLSLFFQDAEDED